jgi:hypothetical protein
VAQLVSIKNVKPFGRVRLPAEHSPPPSDAIVQWKPFGL